MSDQAVRAHTCHVVVVGGGTKKKVEMRGMASKYGCEQDDRNGAQMG